MSPPGGLDDRRCRPEHAVIIPADPRLRLGSGGRRARLPPGGKGQRVAAAGKAGAADVPDGSMHLERARVPRRHCVSRPTRYVLPRRLRRPRHGGRTTHRTPHTRPPTRDEVSGSAIFRRRDTVGMTEEAPMRKWWTIVVALALVATPAGARSVGSARKAAWLSVGHPG